NEITDVGGFDFGLVITKYFEGYINGDDFLKKSSLRWLRGEYTTKTEARLSLGVREIINDSNYYDMLKNFSKFFKQIGYKGFVINIDEAINLYKITNSLMREKNYEKILSMYNDCYQNRGNNIFINIAGTNEFLSNETRGLFSY
ncbi:MAG: BREX system ATP-binding domain-containing protein, partial [Ignavibacteria bacterium]